MIREPAREDPGEQQLPTEEELGETTEIMLSGDVLSIDELSDYPDIRTLNPRHQAIMCAYACGYGQRFIAKMFGITQPAISQLVNKVDPNKMFKVSEASKRAFITRIAESRAVEAISSITPEKLADSSAKELTSIAKDCVSIAQGLNQSKHKEISSGRLDNLLEAVEAERVSVSPSPLEEK